MLSLLAPLAADLVLGLFAAGRAAFSLLLEGPFCELERAFPLFADDVLSDLLFDLKERLSTGIFGSFAASF